MPVGARRQSDDLSQISLKLLSRSTDGDDMEPVDPPAAPPPLPPPGPAGTVDQVATEAAIDADAGVEPAADATEDAGVVAASPAPPPAAVTAGVIRPLLPMLPWRIAGAIALTATFLLIGWQVERLVDDQPWSDALMWLSILAGIVVGGCVLGWTWYAAVNARRLVEPATNRPLPDPRRAVSTWLVPFAFVAVAVAVVASLGENANRNADDTVSPVPLVVAVVCLLIAIPLTYRPLHYLSGMVRQVGGHASDLAKWMWLPVALGFLGIGSIVALRISGAVSEPGDGIADDATNWLPMWVVAVVTIVPCVIVVLLGWRAGASVEEALVFADDRRRRSVDGEGRVRVTARRLPARAHPTASQADRGRVTLVGGVDLLRLCMVTLLAGLALLTVVGAIVMYLFWSESTDGVLLPSQSARAWDAFGVLRGTARGVGFALIAVVSIWTFVSVANVRMASGRRRNPLIAAAAWPAAALGFWIAADRFVVDQPAASVAVGFVVQALILGVPFVLLERAARAVEARRTPLRVTYLFGVVLLVYVQALGGLWTIEETTTTTNYGRLAGFLAVGALIQLLSTLAVTDACRAIEDAAERSAEHHNALVDQREAVAHRARPMPTARGAATATPSRVGAS